LVIGSPGFAAGKPAAGIALLSVVDGTLGAAVEGGAFVVLTGMTLGAVAVGAVPVAAGGATAPEPAAACSAVGATTLGSALAGAEPVSGAFGPAPQAATPKPSSALNKFFRIVMT
jgi:hypothetical protein